MVVACKKNTSPSRVKRIISQGQWKVKRMFYDNGDSTSLYANETFRFTKDGCVWVGGNSVIDGTWKVNQDEKPSRFELTLKPFVPFNLLNADWKFDALTNKRIELSLGKANAKDILVFEKK